MLQATINLLHNKLVYEKLIKLTSSLKRDENFKTFCIKDALKKFLNKRGNSAFQTGIFFPLMVFLCAKFTVHTAELNLKKAMHQFFLFFIFEKSNGFHLFFNFHRLSIDQSTYQFLILGRFLVHNEVKCFVNWFVCQIFEKNI